VAKAVSSGHRDGREPGGGGSIAQSCVTVLAPAESLVGQGRSAAGHGSRDDSAEAPPSRHRRGSGAIDGGAVTQLAPSIVAPAVSNVLQCNGAGVAEPRIHMNEPEATDQGRQPAPVVGGGAQLAPVIQSPTVHPAVGGDPAGMFVASADLHEVEVPPHRERRVPVGDGAIAQLRLGVVPPTVRQVGRGHPAGVVVSPADHLEEGCGGLGGSLRRRGLRPGRRLGAIPTCRGDCNEAGEHSCREQCE
jgi:hypothetical protein